MKLFKRTSKTDERKDKNIDNPKKLNVKIIVLIGFLVFGAYNIGSYFELFNFNFQSSEKEESSLSLGDAVQLQKEGELGRSNTSTGTATASSSRVAPPVNLVNAKTFEELAGLYLLVSRVQESDKSAAELFGLTKISIHAKRNKLVETQLMADNSKHELVFTKNSKTIKGIKDGMIDPREYQTNTQMNGNMPQIPNQNVQDNLGLIDTGITVDSVTDESNESLHESNIDLENLIFKPRDFSLKAMVNDVASLEIKGKRYKTVRKGQPVLSRFEIKKFDYNLECVTIIDRDEESEFVTCING